MKMELLQPFINSADAVLAQTLQCATTVGDVTMEEEVYRRKGLAALVLIRGELEGRIILDIEPRTAAKAASFLTGEEVAETADLVRETVCELANMLIGNAVTSLNDQGFHFKVAPPEIHTAEEGLSTTADTDALVMSFETPHGVVYLNLAIRKNARRRSERSAVARLPV
jgi:chemotaxis protein CheX